MVMYFLKVRIKLVSDIGSLRQWIWFRNLRWLFVENNCDDCDMVCKVYIGVYYVFFSLIGL